MEAGKAIVCHDTLTNNGWKMEEVGVRQPGDGELLVEMVATGVCHTDTLIGSLPGGAAPIAFYPRVLGHEGSGYVKKVGKGVTVAQPGDPVLLSFAFCRDCEVCKAGHHSHCDSFNELNFGGPHRVFSLASKSGEPEIGGAFFGQSSFANLSIVRQCSVVNAKDLVFNRTELQLFAPLGCGIQTGAGTVLNAAQAKPNDVVLVMGLGGVGLSAIMGARIAGCRRIVGLDRIESRLKLAKDLGCTDVIDGSKLGDKSLVETIKEVAGGGGPTIAIDTTGAPPLIKAGLEGIRNRGKFVQVGSAPFDFNLDFNMFQFMVAGKQVIGAVEGQAYPPDFVPQMVQWYREGRFPIDKLMRLMPAQEFERALEEMHDGSTIKPILTW
ncbi:NAD(P)-binding protein [Hortaea werneckii]|uniref:Enoyl reductase (ER) domain-containing protein n=1 Tax=Hortaea werneckii TaxID=91943 RepID=A0A3M7EG37_HORWE|nr:NAD(P)-binding protein [Hortaea werneckii]KAI6862741.1 NAD(P)-binding protein [Hortaea werneckii]KAI7259058.1 NAD(P)-binding protein [Hortaea werneckii]KAI7568404.1 NAD(P)-binding protein [Hortaea werneckii]KAI7611720.1 NAD(P)-binding protein [Hortaea werneckii]